MHAQSSSMHQEILTHFGKDSLNVYVSMSKQHVSWWLQEPHEIQPQMQTEQNQLFGILYSCFHCYEQQQLRLSLHVLIAAEVTIVFVVFRLQKIILMKF